jgi:hypothetical protein
MLNSEDFIVIVVVMVGLLVTGVFVAGWLTRRRGSSPPPAKPRRDPIAEGRIRQSDVTEMLEVENARRRSGGRSQYRRGEFEARLVGDRRFLRRMRRLRLLRGRGAPA